MVQFDIPKQVIEKFKERGKKLAFLSGQKDGDITTISHIIFPIQQAFHPEFEQGNFITNIFVLII